MRVDAPPFPHRPRPNAHKRRTKRLASPAVRSSLSLTTPPCRRCRHPSSCNTTTPEAVAQDEGSFVRSFAFSLPSNPSYCPPPFLVVAGRRAARHVRSARLVVACLCQMNRARKHARACAFFLGRPGSFLDHHHPLPALFPQPTTFRWATFAPHACMVVSSKLTAMDLVKALRRSMKGEKHKPNSPSIGSKSALAIVPPKKVGLSRCDASPPGAPSPALCHRRHKDDSYMCMASGKYEAMLTS